MAYPVNIAPFLPRWVAQLVMPIGLFLIAVHLIMNGYNKWRNRGILLAGVIFLSQVSRFDSLRESSIFMWVSILLILFAIITFRLMTLV